MFRQLKVGNYIDSDKINQMRYQTSMETSNTRQEELDQKQPTTIQYYS